MPAAWSGACRGVKKREPSQGKRENREAIMLGLWAEESYCSLFQGCGKKKKKIE